MATTLTTNTFGGRFSGVELITKTLLANNSVQRGLLRVEDNVKNKLVMRTAEFVPQVQSYKQEGGSVSPTLTGDEFILETVKYMTKGKMFLETFRRSWESLQIAQGSINDMDVQPLTDEIVNYTAQQLAIINDKLYWLGKAGLAAAEIIDTGGDPFPAYQGLLPKAIADSGVKKLAQSIGQITITGISAAANAVVTHASGANANLEVGDIVTFTQGVGGMEQIRGLSGMVLEKTATTTTVDVNSTGFTAYTSGGFLRFINASNVLQVLAAAISNTPRQSVIKPDFKLYVPGYLDNVILSAMSNQAKDNGFRFVSENIDGELVQYIFGKYRIEFMEYWRPNVLFGATSNDLYLGVDLLDEEQNLNLIDLRDVSNDDAISYRAVMKSTTNYPALKARDFLIVQP